jgi:hypothetical protein
VEEPAGRDFVKTKFAHHDSIESYVNMSAATPVNLNATRNTTLSVSSALSLDSRAAAAPTPPTARFGRTQNLALQQGGWNDKMDSASLARLSPHGLVDRFMKNGLIEIDTNGNAAVEKQLVKDLIDIAATPYGRQTMLGALKNRLGGTGYTPFSIKIEAGDVGAAGTNAITLGTKLFAEKCHLVGDTVSSARSIFVLFHELVHVHQYKAQSKMTLDQMEDDATKRTDVFINQFNRANGTNYPLRRTYGSQTEVVCPATDSKQMPKAEQLKVEIEKFKAVYAPRSATQRQVVELVLDRIVRRMEDLVRVEFGSDTLREPGGTGRRKLVLDSLLTLRSAISQMRNDKPVVSTQLDKFLQIYKQSYKKFFDAMAIDKPPISPGRRTGGAVKQ